MRLGARSLTRQARGPAPASIGSQYSTSAGQIQHHIQPAWLSGTASHSYVYHAMRRSLVRFWVWAASRRDRHSVCFFCLSPLVLVLHNEKSSPQLLATTCPVSVHGQSLIVRCILLGLGNGGCVLSDNNFLESLQSLGIFFS